MSGPRTPRPGTTGPKWPAALLPVAVAVARTAIFAITGAIAAEASRWAPPGQVHDLCVGTARLVAWPFGGLARRHGLIALRDIRLPVLQHMLCSATRHGGVPLRLRTENGNLLETMFREHGRLLLCTAHLGLTMAIQRVLHDRAIPLQMIGSPGRTDGLHWGCPRPAPIINSDTMSLLRARRVLTEGHALLAYPDTMKRTGAAFTFQVRRNLFHFAARTHTPVLFFDARLARDGAIVVHIMKPRQSQPGIPCNAESMAQSFCDFLRARTDLPYRLEQPARKALRKTALPQA